GPFPTQAAVTLSLMDCSVLAVANTEQISLDDPLTCLWSEQAGTRPRSGQVAVRQGKAEYVQQHGHGHGSEVPGIRITHGGVGAESGREADRPGRRESPPEPAVSLPKAP